MGRRFKGRRLEWSEVNLQFAIDRIPHHLTIDLVPRKWRQWNIENSLIGHCHNATGALYMLFGPKYFDLYSGPAVRVEDGRHFWVVRKDTKELIDLTAGQFTEPYDYSQGVRSQMLSFQFYERAKSVYLKVLQDYDETFLNL